MQRARAPERGTAKRLQDTIETMPLEVALRALDKLKTVRIGGGEAMPLERRLYGRALSLLRDQLFPNGEGGDGRVPAADPLAPYFLIGGGASFSLVSTNFDQLLAR